MCRPALVVGAGLLLLGAVQPGVAQTQRSGSGDAQRLAQMQMQLQQAQGEKATLQAENAALKQEVEALKRQLSGTTGASEGLQRRAAAAEAEARRLAASTASSAENAARSKAQLEELITRFRDTAKALKDTEQARDEQAEAARTAQRELGVCTERNARLIAMNDEILVRLENTGFWSRLAADEPFTRLKRTELENLADGYRSESRGLELASPAPSP
jgi:chromosome segregation ATPase